MPFIELDPLAMRKDKFCSLGANASMEMMAYRKVEDKRSVAKGGTPQGEAGAVPGRDGSMCKGPVVRVTEVAPHRASGSSQRSGSSWRLVRPGHLRVFYFTLEYHGDPLKKELQGNEMMKLVF